MTSIDVDGLRDKVKAMYQAVADEPQAAGVARRPWAMVTRVSS